MSSTGSGALTSRSPTPGILSRAATLRTTPTSSIESLLAVNVTGVVNTIQAAMDQVIAHRGQFVLISSVFAFLNGMGTIPYAMSKAAVEQLGRGLRVELAEHGVSTTTAYFSLIETNMIKQGVDADPVVDELLAALPRTPAQAPSTRALPQQHSPTASRTVRPRVMEPARWTAHLGAARAHRPRTGFAPGPRPRTLAALSELDARSHTAP